MPPEANKWIGLPGHRECLVSAETPRRAICAQFPGQIERSGDAGDSSDSAHDAQTNALPDALTSQTASVVCTLAAVGAGAAASLSI